MTNIRRAIVPAFVLSGLLVGCHPSILALPQVATSVSLPSSKLMTPAKLPDMVNIPFDNLAQGDSYTAEVEIPTLFVATNAAQATRFTQWLNNTDITNQIQAVDFNTTWVVAVFRGQVGSSGYGITVEEISTAPKTVQIKVNVTEPAPDRVVSTVISYPYHIILIPREKLRVAPGIIWSVQTIGGKLLVQTYP